MAVATNIRTRAPEVREPRRGGTGGRDGDRLPRSSTAGFPARAQGGETSSHKRADVRAMIEAAGAQLVFRRSYNPVSIR